MAGEGALIHFTQLELKAMWLTMAAIPRPPFTDHDLEGAAESALNKVYRAERGM